MVHYHVCSKHFLGRTNSQTLLRGRTRVMGSMNCTSLGLPVLSCGSIFWVQLLILSGFTQNLLGRIACDPMQTQVYWYPYLFLSITYDLIILIREYFAVAKQTGL